MALVSCRGSPGGQKQPGTAVEGRGGGCEMMTLTENRTLRKSTGVGVSTDQRRRLTGRYNERECSQKSTSINSDARAQHLPHNYKNCQPKIFTFPKKV